MEFIAEVDGICAYTLVAIVGGFTFSACSFTEPFHMLKFGVGWTTTGLWERSASATEMLTTGLEKSW